MSSLTLRPAVAADYKACQSLTNQKANREGFSFFQRVVFTDFIQRMEAGEHRYVVLVAEAGDTVVGFLRGLVRLDGRATLHEICVDSTTHSRGVGKALLTELENMARAQGATHLMVKTPVPIAANGFYTAVGFTHLRVEQAKVRKVNVYRKDL